MNKKVLTAEEIKTALKHCANIHVVCSECILFDPKDDDCKCSAILKANALEYIETLERETVSKGE